MAHFIDPYQEGREGFFQGKKNPYRRNSKDALRWALGFDGARRGFKKLCNKRKSY